MESKEFVRKYNEMNAGEKEFHRKRTAFLIVDNKLVFLPEKSEKSHFHFAQDIGLSELDLNIINRGYHLNGKIIFYYGNFDFNEKTISDAKRHSSAVMEYCGVQKAEIWCGVKIGKFGDIWPPVHFITSIDKTTQLIE